MRRLFPTFARGWPGVGLLLLCLVVGIASIWRVVEELNGGPSLQVIALCAVAIGLARLPLAGLWTPVAGTLIAVLEQIADQFSITEETVKGRVKHILSKLGANDRTQAAMIRFESRYHRTVGSTIRGSRLVIPGIDFRNCVGTVVFRPATATV